MRRWRSIAGSWLGVWLVAACGDAIVPEPDARPPIEHGLARVSFQFHADAVSLDGMPVYFQNPDSSLALATRTDANGRATALMQPGGFVTLALPNGSLWTYAGVRPEDVLVVDERSTETTEERTSFGITVPASPGADIYSLASSCGSTDITGAQEEMMTATLFDCDGVADLLVTTRNLDPRPFGSNYRYLYKRGVVVEPQTPVVLDGAYLPMNPSTITAVGVPADAPRIRIGQLLVRDGRDVSEPRSAVVDVTGGAAQAALSRMYAPADGTTQTYVTHVGTAGPGAHQTVVWGPSTEVTTVDLAAVRVRPYIALPVLDLTTTSVRWTESSQGDLADVVVLGLQWRDAGNRLRTWKILAPRDEESVVRFPTLPIADLVPTDTTTITNLANIAVPGDADPLRTSLLGTWPRSGSWPARGESGRVDYEELAPVP